MLLTCSGNYFNDFLAVFSIINLFHIYMLNQSHQYEIIIVNSFIQGHKNMTRVQNAPRFWMIIMMRDDRVPDYVPDCPSNVIRVA